MVLHGARRLVRLSQAFGSGSDRRWTVRRAATYSMHVITLAVHPPNKQKHKSSKQQNKKKRPKSLLFLVPEIGHQSAPNLCGIEVSLEFTKDTSIPQISEPHLVPVSGHKNRVQFLHWTLRSSDSATLL